MLPRMVGGGLGETNRLVRMRHGREATVQVSFADPVVSANRKPSRNRFQIDTTYGALLKQADK
jgi:hypothetical protein